MHCLRTNNVSNILEYWNIQDCHIKMAPHYRTTRKWLGWGFQASHILIDYSIPLLLKPLLFEIILIFWWCMVKNISDTFIHSKTITARILLKITHILIDLVHYKTVISHPVINRSSFWLTVWLQLLAAYGSYKNIQNHRYKFPQIGFHLLSKDKQFYELRYQIKTHLLMVKTNKQVEVQLSCMKCLALL